ncbi:MAG: helix-turn-helix domain-containing protein [Ignavibacteria bacterium]|nr:helix-turn-helix domain-containing protein [Ignavibacteria bacterium]
MEKQIGSRIVRLRENLNISQEILAERASVTSIQLQEIENNKIIPSLAPLIRIARALGVRLGTFMEDHENIGPTICKNGECCAAINFSNNNATERTSMQYFPLAAKKTGRHMEPFIIDVKSNSDEYILSSHEGEEFIYVLQGEIEVVYGNDKYILKQGDTIYYDSIVQHHVHATGGSDAKILAVVYIPI